ncbi:hypothetical protein [Denitrobaculum tricleocarpae]|uniref:Uncharacterized protein n=1 Tax=Denitrobaculum tricleocarpae TaxID=2591009 RepID=A0A545TN44_9PROT|nr:hypothetical protein [Denitrobaculum tricleocarpae]TQV78634.1 hypothetical protein FKG95_18985 [Denitrobaculum tricleocarpae]
MSKDLQADTAPDIYVETVSSINFNNGVVRLFMVDQNPSELMEKDADPSKLTPRLKQQVIMPLPGFIYMLSVIRGLMEDPKMQGIVEKYVELGLLNKGPDESGAEQTGAQKTGPVQTDAVEAAE